MNIRKLAISSILAGIALVGAESAQAATVYGAVEQVRTMISGGVTYTQVFLSQSQLIAPLYWYYFQTTDAVLANSMAASLHKNIWVQSNTSCATTGTTRYCGVATGMYAN